MTTVNDIILDLIDKLRQATPDEIGTIVAHVAQVPFATYLSRVPIRVRDALAQRGIVCPAKMPNLEWHLLERVYLDQQWPLGTTTIEYVTDLHLAITHTEAQLWTYRYFGQPYASFFSPAHVQGCLGSERYLFVAYSPVFGTLTTGYQTSSLQYVFDTNCQVLIRHC